MTAETIVLTLSYDGAGFAGFARQPAQRTVQGRIEESLGTILRSDVHIVGAGRTDSGVHALGQVVSFAATGNEPDDRTLLRSLNALLARDIVVTGVRRAAPSFSARYSARAREYRYRLVPGSVPPLFLAGRSWWTNSPLDLGAMRTAAAVLVGEHDFRSFCVTASSKGERTQRRVELLDIFPEIQFGEHSIVIRIVGNAFLHSMIRIIVGSLVEIGKGRKPDSWIAEVLAAEHREVAGPTAPAKGLVFWHVDYPEDYWL